MSDTTLRQTVRAVINLPNRSRLIDFGRTLGRLYTDNGLPIDIAMDELPEGTTIDEKTVILVGVGEWLIEHKRKSGATEAAIERQRKANVKMLADYQAKGEVGLY